MHPRDEQIAAIAATIIRLTGQNQMPSRVDVARASGFTLMRVERSWGAAMAIVEQQQRRAQDRAQVDASSS